jgi:hypothetical protein
MILPPARCRFTSTTSFTTTCPPFKDEPPAKTLGGAGAASPDTKATKPASGPCAGAILVDFKDASAVNTAVGQIAIGIMVIGAAGMAGVMPRRV